MLFKGNNYQSDRLLNNVPYAFICFQQGGVSFISFLAFFQSCIYLVCIGYRSYKCIHLVPFFFFFFSFLIFIVLQLLIPLFGCENFVRQYL